MFNLIFSTPSLHKQCRRILRHSFGRIIKTCSTFATPDRNATHRQHSVHYFHKFTVLFLSISPWWLYVCICSPLKLGGTPSGRIGPSCHPTSKIASRQTTESATKAPNPSQTLKLYTNMQFQLIRRSLDVLCRRRRFRDASLASGASLCFVLRVSRKGSKILQFPENAT